MTALLMAPSPGTCAAAMDAAMVSPVLGNETEPQADSESLRKVGADDTAELPKPDPFPDDRSTCSQCANLRQRACANAKPERGALVVANRGYRPDPAWRLRCEGYAPGADDPDRRHGRERWPGLTDTKGGE
jgi:hypothetical protein